MNEANKEDRQKIKANEDTVYQVLKAAQDDRKLSPDCSLTNEVNLEFCLLDHFARLTVPFLKIFILAHDE